MWGTVNVCDPLVDQSTPTNGNANSYITRFKNTFELPPNAHLLYDVPSPPLAQPSAPPAGGAAAGERRPREAPNGPLTANILQHADGQPLPFPSRLGGASTAGDGLEW